MKMSMIRIVTLIWLIPALALAENARLQALGRPLIIDDPLRIARNPSLITHYDAFGQATFSSADPAGPILSIKNILDAPPVYLAIRSEREGLMRPYEYETLLSAANRIENVDFVQEEMTKIPRIMAATVYQNFRLGGELAIEYDWLKENSMRTFRGSGRFPRYDTTIVRTSGKVSVIGFKAGAQRQGVIGDLSGYAAVYIPKIDGRYTYERYGRWAIPHVVDTQQAYDKNAFIFETGLEMAKLSRSGHVFLGGDLRLADQQHYYYHQWKQFGGSSSNDSVYVFFDDNTPYYRSLHYRGYIGALLEEENSLMGFEIVTDGLYQSRKPQKVRAIDTTWYNHYTNDMTLDVRAFLERRFAPERGFLDSYTIRAGVGQKTRLMRNSRYDAKGPLGGSNIQRDRKIKERTIFAPLEESFSATFGAGFEKDIAALDILVDLSHWKGAFKGPIGAGATLSIDLTKRNRY
jgi:hypothetical protein